MGKQGPCYHCGVTSTPLWRNGPPEKPVLCNACGSRWRTKGTLANYTPLHARIDPVDYEDRKVARVKTISLKKRDDKLTKRKINYDNIKDEGFTPDYSLGIQRNIDEDTSNRSSSGSAISNSGSCAQFGSADASELTGPSQSIVWDALVPSKKRTCVTRPKPSSVEKLTKDLYTILHEQASHFSVSSEEDLLYESEAPMVSVEIGHGSVLIRHPSSIAGEEDSEASSLSVDNKFCRADEGYSNPASMLLLNDRKSVSNSYLEAEKVKKLNGQIMQLEQVKREKYDHEKFQILWSRDSLLSHIDLSEIANADVFCDLLTNEERQDLLKYLPTMDTTTVSDSLESITSAQFKENLSSFQQLLADGVFDTSFSGVQIEDCKVVKRLALTDMTKCKWVQYYNMLKEKRAKESTGESVRISEAKSSFSGNVFDGKRSREGHNCLWREMKSATKNAKRVLFKVDSKSKQPLQNEGSCFTPEPSNLFKLPINGSNFMLDSYQFEDESSDQDLLLNVPSNGSYPQAEAELLCPTSGFASQQASVSSSIHMTNLRP